MTAILTPQPSPSGGCATLPPPARLVLLDGGRSPRRLEATYRRRRGAAAAILIVVALAVLVGVRAGLAAVTPHVQVTTPQSVAPGGPTVVVRPGDTLWSIARRIQPAGDVRAVVDRLVAIHGGGVLQPGERLALPAD